MSGTARGIPLSEILQELADDESRERVSIGDLLNALDDRAIGAMLFIFAFPNVLPMPPGTSAILGAPLVFLAAQLAFNLDPWLPGFIAKRSMLRVDFQMLIRRVTPWLMRAEKMLRPRASRLALPPMEYVVGLVCLLMAISVVLPIPFGNMLPALSISMLALGVLERDGYWIVGGFVVAVISSVVVSGVVLALIKAGIYMVTQIFA